MSAITGPAQVQQNSLQKAPLDLLDHLVSAGEQRRIRTPARAWSALHTVRAALPNKRAAGLALEMIR